jgi:pimeloyl-ACP methyl ester carboxylesterase
VPAMPIDLLTHLTYRGGQGEPLILVHGLMGRGSTWSRQIPWLTRLGAVYTYDALWHRGRDVDDPHPISTERFVADLADAVAALGTPARLVGHSMGALHSWCLAAERPDLVSALVVEDMAPDFRGRTTGRGSLGCMPFRSNSTRPKKYSVHSGPSRGSTSWRRSTAPPPVGDCTVTHRDGSRSRRNGAPVITGRSGWQCGRRRCSSRRAIRSRRRARCTR